MRRIRVPVLTAVMASALWASAPAAQSAAATIESDLPSCLAIVFPGPTGEITVQTTNNTVAWGVRMYRSEHSVGRWDVDTFVNGKKGKIGFHRTTTGPYIPHGAPKVPSGKRFSIQATVVNPDGQKHISVPNSCIVP